MTTIYRAVLCCKEDTKRIELWLCFEQPPTSWSGYWKLLEQVPGGNEPQTFILIGLGVGKSKMKTSTESVSSEARILRGWIFLRHPFVI